MLCFVYIQIFSGIEGIDTIGPGTYDIDLPEYWKKKGTFWSKNKDIRSYQDKKKIRPYDHVWDMYYDEFEDYDDQEKKS